MEMVLVSKTKCQQAQVLILKKDEQRRSGSDSDRLMI